MLLRKLHIRNFRGIEDLEFDLGPTTLLIGENNCGKSTILDAIRLTLSRASGRKSGTFDVFDYRLKTAASEPQSADELSITATFSQIEGEQLSEEFTQTLTDAIVTDAVGRSHIIFRVTSQFDASLNDFVSDWSFLDTDLNALGSKARRPSLLQDFQKLFPVFYLSALRDAVREFRSGQFWSPFVKNPSIPDNIKADLQKQIVELNAAVLGAHTSLKTVKSHLQKVQELVPVGQTDMVEIEALPARISDLLSNTQVSISSPTGASIPLGRHGAGTQSLSVMFLFEAYLTAMFKQQFSDLSAPILALEEPEAHLHPFAIRSLWGTINSVPGQKIIASHSGDLVANAPLSSIRRLYTSNSKVTVGAVTPGILDEDDERKICFHVIQSRGELLFARCWLLLEGESEFWILDGLARLLKRPIDRWGVRIVTFQHSGQGCLLKTANGLGIPWFLLADGDPAGKAYIKGATDQLNGATPADHLLELAEDNVEVHLCACGFEKIFAAHIAPQKAHLVTSAPGTVNYWKQVLKAKDDTPKPMVIQEVCAEIEKGAAAPPKLVDVLDRALKLAGGYRTILSSIFSFNIRRGRYDANPVKAVRQQKEPPGRDSLMTPDEFRQFRSKCQALGDYELDCFAVLATTTALRKGSLLPRKWTDVYNLDGDLPYIMVPITKNGEPKPAVLSDEAVEALKRLPSYGTSEYLFPAKPNPRFKGDFKRPYAWDLGKRFRRVCRLIGVRTGTIGEVGPRIHDWRHFSASILLGKGVPDNVIAKHTGHKSKALERYKHLFPQLREETVQLIDSEVKIPKKKD